MWNLGFGQTLEYARSLMPAGASEPSIWEPPPIAQVRSFHEFVVESNAMGLPVASVGPWEARL